MPEVQAVSKPNNVKCWLLDDAQDMATAMMFLEGQGYYGHISNLPNPAAVIEYKLSLSSSAMQDAVVGRIGDVLYWDDSTNLLGSMPQAVFEATYDVTT